MANVKARTVLAVTCAAFAVTTVVACGTSSREIREAKSSGYRADFALVYNEAVAATRNVYPNLVEDATAGTIRTAWHVVRFNEGQVDPTSQQSRDSQAREDQATGAGNANPFGQSGLARKTHFIRFDVAVIGGDPWRLSIRAQASRWTAGEVPVPLKGGDEPHWLQGRIDALYVAIHRRLEKYKVKLATRPSNATEVEQIIKPKFEPGQFGPIPPAAAEAVAFVLQSASMRDLVNLREHMADDFTWSLGGTPGADMAIMMWQADTSVLNHLEEILRAGCRVDEEGARVSCPPEYSERAGYLGYRAEFAQTAPGVWKLTLFASGE
jgi:hypothetical protein